MVDGLSYQCLVHLLLLLPSKCLCCKKFAVDRKHVLRKKVVLAYSMGIAWYSRVPSNMFTITSGFPCDKKPAIYYEEFATFLILDPHNTVQIIFCSAEHRAGRSEILNTFSKKSRCNFWEIIFGEVARLLFCWVYSSHKVDLLMS